MNKQESQNLMIGSWVLAEGKPRTPKRVPQQREADRQNLKSIRGNLLKQCIKYGAQ